MGLTDEIFANIDRIMELCEENKRDVESIKEQFNNL
jgi:hypothetical protein